MLNRRHALGLALAAAFTPRVAHAGQAERISVPIRLTRNRLIVEVALNGRGPYDFIIDTGAEISGLSLRLAGELGLDPHSDILINGRRAPLFNIDRLRLGDALQQSRALMFGIDDRGLGGDGLLPAGLLTLHDSELDFGAGLWSIYPRGRPGFEGFTRLASDISRPREGLSSRLSAAIAVDGQALRPVWDTGAPHALSVDWATGARLGLTAADRPSVRIPYAVIGRGEVEPARLVRARRLSIGPVEHADVPVLVRPESVGRGAPLLGLPMIRTLDLAIDAGRGALWVRPNHISAIS